MTNAELEIACHTEFSGTAVWHSWTSEIYSFGKCLRYMASYPEIFPLFVQSDHGVGLEMGLYPHELNNNAKIHLTWHPGKELRYKNSTNPQALRIAHPWIFYRHALTKVRSDAHRGTIVFFTHHVPGVKWEGHDSEEYFAQLRALPDKFQPAILCLHMHDINAGHHKELRRHGFPIVTAGNASSTNFVDRFYDLIKDYSYATSQGWGSQVAYCVEFGLPYFFVGGRPKLINVSHPDMELGEVAAQDEDHLVLERQADELFRLPVDTVTPEQRAFVESLLGLDSKITPKQISRILWREFFHNWPKWYLVPMGFILILFRMVGLKPMLKKIWGYIS